jgi:hypothetical protein
LEQNAMQVANDFLAKFQSRIVSALGCFDRVIFKGHLPFGNDRYLNSFVDGSLRIRRKDFLPFIEQHSQALVDHAQAMAAQAGAPYQRLEGRCRKEAMIQKLLAQTRHADGLVAVLCCMETCRTVKLLHARHRPYLAYRLRPQRVLYFYFLDPNFGLVYLRLQTWFPFTAQVYVNGHEWLARQLHRHRSGFVQCDNAFTELDNPALAQRLADRFAHLPWVRQLNRWLRSINPVLKESWLEGRSYYWVTDQAEYSTDVLFQSSHELAQLYPRLLDHAALQLSAQDILTFLGRRLHHRFDGEVLTSCRKDRQPGARIKHRVKNNWLKMYDKFGLILRIETVINQPREFKVRRYRCRRGQRQLLWCPMNKGVANFYRYHQVAAAANQRYLNALAIVEGPSATIAQAECVSQPVRFHGRRRRALNLLRQQEQRLFFAVLQGQSRLHGFRNRDLTPALFSRPATTPAQRRSRTAHVSRLLQLLRAHGLIAKIPHSHRYRVSAKGEALMTTAIYVRCKAFPKELAAAA